MKFSLAKKSLSFVRARRLLLPLLLFLPLVAFRLGAAEEPPFGLNERIPWTNSHVVGSPEPPLPYTVEKTFTNIQWKAPIFIAPEPGTNYLWFVQAGGEKERPSRIVRVLDDPSARVMDVVLETPGWLTYSFAFHPGYRTNGYIFVFNNGPSGEKAHTNRISRFTVPRDGSARIDTATEYVVIEWQCTGHSGGGIVFGHDGMLYLTSGDGTSDSDGWNTGQDLSELLGGVMRIDADHPTSAEQHYSIPKDNPFLTMTNARPENWAYGLRNPWRMSIDDRTGQIWVGNNGQDLWETAHLLLRSANYGWSVYEGSHPFYLNRKVGPTPPVPPTVEHSHADFRSLTGGAVYYGKPLRELEGTYIYGDYTTGEIWGAKHNGTRLTFHKQLAQTQIQITAFACDQQGDMLIADHVGAIYRLVPAPKEKNPAKFPRRLSETGLFASTKTHTVDPGVVPYTINAQAWNDGAIVERFMGFPGSKNRVGHYEDGAVLLQTLSIERETGRPESRQRIESRILTQQGGQWYGYSYRWNSAQTDATLVEAKGDQQTIKTHGPGSKAVREQVWRFPSRAECLACHSRAANFILGISDPQLNRTNDYHGIADNQLRAFKHIGVNTGSLPKPTDPVLVDPYDPSQPLDKRARSYLHVNCSVCHVEAGGGNSKMELGFNASAERMSLISARPLHDTFGIANSMLVAPGDPAHSILIERLSRRGRGQMPPLVSTCVDERAVALFRDWISSMKPAQEFVREWRLSELLPSLAKLDEQRDFQSGSNAFRSVGCVQCHQIASSGGAVGPDLTNVRSRMKPREVLESILEPSKTIAEGFGNTILETKAGERIQGRIQSEDDRTVVIRPLEAFDEPRTIAKRDLRRREVSTQSNMPTGTLNTLNETQILDLLKYVLSEGKAF